MPKAELKPKRRLVAVKRSPQFKTFQAEVAALRQDLADMVRQNCGVYPKPAGYDYDAGFISVHAGVMRYLCSVGMFEMVNDGYGRCVQIKEKDDANQPA